MKNKNIMPISIYLAILTVLVSSSMYYAFVYTKPIEYIVAINADIPVQGLPVAANISDNLNCKKVINKNYYLNTHLKLPTLKNKKIDIIFYSTLSDFIRKAKKRNHQVYIIEITQSHINAIQFAGSDIDLNLYLSTNLANQNFICYPSKKTPTRFQSTSSTLETMYDNVPGVKVISIGLPEKLLKNNKDRTEFSTYFTKYLKEYLK